MPSPQSREDVVRRIEGARFGVVRMREGYRESDVDAFLDQLVVAVRAGRPLEPLVAAARFIPVRGRGYDMGQVDTFLDEAVTAAGETVSYPTDGLADPASAGSLPAADDLAAQVAQARFTVVRVRESYRIEDVDGFLDRLASALRAGQPVAPMVSAVRFRPIRGRGYEMREVDRFLAAVVARAPGPAGAGSGPIAGSAADPTSWTAPPAPPTPPASAPPLTAPDDPGAAASVIQEQKGALRRWFGR